MSDTGDNAKAEYKKTLCPQCGKEPDCVRFSTVHPASASCSACNTSWSPALVRVTADDTSQSTAKMTESNTPEKITVNDIVNQVTMIEGFNIRFLRNGKKVRSDCGGVSKYPYKNAGYGTWTVKQWKDTRMAEYLDDFDVEVLESDGTPAAGNRTLKKLRDLYPSKPQPSSALPKATLKSIESEVVQVKRVEKEMYPKLRRNNPSSVPSIEIAVDYVPDEYKGECLDLLLNLVQKWIDDNSFTKEGVIWQWCCSPTTDFMHLWGPVFSEFICMIGLPAKCREYVASNLERKLGKAVKYPADALGSGELEDALSLAYISDGIVWQSLDPCTWLTVKKMEN